MNWKRAKTAFIFVFILVNIMLIVIYANKVNQSHIQDSEQENKVNFKQEQISIPGDLPTTKNLKTQLLTARSNDFSEYAKSHSKVATENDGTTLKGDIDRTIEVNEDQTDDLKAYVRDKIYDGKAYELRSINDDEAVFEQVHKGYPVMDNSKARLTFKIENGKATRFEQTLMSHIKPSNGENNEPEQVNSARSAIETLYFNSYLERHDEVSNIHLGYYTVVKEPNVQVLQSNWAIDVKHKGKTTTYYVEAVGNDPHVVKEN